MKPLTHSGRTGKVEARATTAQTNHTHYPLQVTKEVSAHLRASSGVPPSPTKPRPLTAGSVGTSGRGERGHKNTEQPRHVPTSSRSASLWASRSRRGTACSRPPRRTWSRRSCRARLVVNVSRERPSPATTVPAAPATPAAPARPSTRGPQRLPPLLFHILVAVLLRGPRIAGPDGCTKTSGPGAAPAWRPGTHFTLAPQTPSREGRANQRPGPLSPRPIRTHGPDACSGTTAELPEDARSEEGRKPERPPLPRAQPQQEGSS